MQRLLSWLWARWYSFSRLLDVSQAPELPREPWLGTLVPVAGFLQRQRYTEAGRICEGVETVTHLSEASH